MTGRMKALFTIVNRGDGLALSSLYKQNGVPLHLQIAAMGTASSELLNILGLSGHEKDLLFSIAPEDAVEGLLENLNEDLGGILSVRGIAFSVHMTAVSHFIATAFSGDAPVEGEIGMHNEKEYSLIVVAVNQGSTDPVMQTACRAGATGGTVMRSRWVGADKLEQFHGITLQDEKEVLIIACLREKRNAIMDAITESHGIHTQDQALLCSLPIDRLVRLG